MSQSPFARSLFISACVSGIAFSIAATPFALLKSNTVGLSVQNRDVYSAELKYLAGPYLALAGGVSAALGLGVFGLVGWRQSARKIASSESDRQNLAHSLSVHQAELERIKFSEARLRSQNLSGFLQPEIASLPVAQSNDFQEAVALELAAKAAAESRSPVPPMSFVVAPSVRPSALPEESQSFDQVASLGAAVNPVHVSAPDTVAEPLESLLQQLQQISKQVEELRGHGGNQLAA